ncbi:MAG: alpha-galactosidase [Faecalicoccus sp.]|nr:alpha-galactosidase [Faecalicoccus sp.]
MIEVRDDFFCMHTENTTYSFQILKSGHPEHLYYGKRIHGSREVLEEKTHFEVGNTIVYSKEYPTLMLEDTCLELSSIGKGDIREPLIEITYEDGTYTSDFIFQKYEILEGDIVFDTLPTAYGADHTLRTIYKERYHDVLLEIDYSVFEKTDVITRKTRLINHMNQSLTIDRLLSNQIDYHGSNYRFTMFSGAWAREMQRKDVLLSAGKVVVDSYTGTTSNRLNSFVMISNPNTDQTNGDCWGYHLVYSGNHYECTDISAYGKLRFVQGINPRSFAFVLGQDEVFEAPEAVMSFADEGFNSLSNHLHNFIREHIVRGIWKNRPRPILLNSWEAAYFDINEIRLLRLADAASKVGIELFVMDDGWFGKRDDDTSSLGDWNVNRAKIPGGLSRLASRINDMGMDFGIWVEPEMINVDSKLYKKHKDWVMEIPGQEHSEGRNQRILDLCNPDVVDHIIKTMSELFASAHISYVKWDMNRIFSDVYSPYLPKNRQKEVFHRYVMGFYAIMKTLTAKFPDILFEGCASGGNRFDLGMLCYYPQIWASDDTDAIERALIQEGYSYGYPMSVVTSHVSASPNHQTLRRTPLETRYNVAAFGVLGYELNILHLSAAQRKKVSDQIELYKKWRDVFFYGTFYRLRTGNVHEWCVVSPDKKRAVGMILQEMVTPNTQYEVFHARGLDPDKEYHFYSFEQKLDIRLFGDLINSQSPIRIKQGSAIHNTLARLIDMPGETEDAYASGNTLMHAGVKLKPAFSGSGYSDQVRYFSDYSSRLYFIEEKEL